MSGYRQHSYDPNAYQQPGPVMRPYNWVQWTGVGFGLLGMAIFLADLAARAGWVPELLDSSTPTFGLFAAAVILINSRREPADEPAPELVAERRRWLIVIGLVCAVILGAAAFFELGGAAQ